jgi:hypothetical protein
MVHLAVDWSTISSLATGFGTLVLAVATFAAVRSSNRSARLAEQALQEQRRPIFTQSRLDDPVQKIMFVERHWVVARGGHGVAEHDGNIYFAMSLRNVGAGIGVCQGWHVAPGLQAAGVARDHTPENQFRLQSRDLYIPAGDIGMWQGALRDRNDPTYQAVAAAIDNREVISVELLYSDQVGDQRTISRFGLVPYERPDENGNVSVEWFAAINRHWYLDRAGPRSDAQIAAAVDVVVREREMAEELARAEAEAAEAEVEATEGEAEPEGVEADAEAEPEGVAADGLRAEPNGARRAETDRSEPVAVIPRPNCE